MLVTQANTILVLRKSNLTVIILLPTRDSNLLFMKYIKAAVLIIWLDEL